MFARLPSFGAWLMCAALPNMARAESSAPRKRPTLHVGFDAWEDARQGFDLDAEGERADSELVGSARLRTGFDARLGGPKLRLVGELDFFARRLHGVPEATGPVQVDPAVRTREPFHPFPLQLRRLYLDWTTWLGVVRLGTQTSQWGLGILANAGERDDRLFGEPTRGNVSQRLLFATSPFQAIGASPTSALGRFTLLAAGDLVVADETAELLDTRLAVEDEAWQAVVSAFIRPRAFDTPALRPRTDVSGGLYAARRWQTYAEGDTLDVWVVDGHLRLLQDWEGHNRIRYEMEFAQLFGETDRVRTEGGPRGVDVEGLGAAAELAWAFQIGALPAEVQVTVGMASGDGDADDSTLQRFAFHGDYDVGLVLFDHVVPALQLRATESVDDPLRAKTPPTGFQYFPGRGGVSGASYGALRFKIGPVNGLEVAAQVLAASTTAPFVDPVRTFERGGAPTNPFGGPAEGNLGTEFDVAVRWRLPEIAPETRPALRLAWGVLLPGTVLEGPGASLGTVHAAQLKLSVDSHLGGGM